MRQGQGPDARRHDEGDTRVALSPVHYIDRAQSSRALYSGRVATLEGGDVFRASVPVAWSVAGSGRDEISDLVASIIEQDGSLAAAELAKAGGVSVRTAQRWIRRLAEGGKLKARATPTDMPCVTRVRMARRHSVACMSRHCRTTRCHAPRSNAFCGMP